jgi:hypothetical protein
MSEVLWHGGDDGRALLAAARRAASSRTWSSESRPALVASAVAEKSRASLSACQ